MTCHTERNFTLVERASYRSIPGHPRWMVAPIEMAWEGKSVGEICRQIKDPAALVEEGEIEKPAGLAMVTVQGCITQLTISTTKRFPLGRRIG